MPVVSWTRDGNLLTEQGASIRVISSSGELKAEIAHEKESGAMQPYRLQRRPHCFRARNVENPLGEYLAQ